MSNFKPVYGKTVILSESSDPWYIDSMDDKVDAYNEDNEDNEDNAVVNTNRILPIDPKVDEVTVRIRYIKRICKQALLVIIAVIVIVLVGYRCTIVKRFIKNLIKVLFHQSTVLYLEP